MSDSWDQYLSNLEDSFSVDQMFFNELQKKSQEQDDSAGDLDNEGELSVDIYQTTDKIIIFASVAGVSSKDLSLNFHNDVLTIRGKRKFPISEKNLGLKTVYQDCYWGSFSKSVVLPETVTAENIKAELKNGLLLIELPIQKKQPKKIQIKDLED